MSIWEEVPFLGEAVTLVGTILGPLLTIVTMAWVLVTKKNPTSAVAWCLVLFFLPLVGPLLFYFFGYQHVNRPLARKRRQKKHFQRSNPSPRAESTPGPTEAVGPVVQAHGPAGSTWEDIGRLAQRCGAFPVTAGNHVTFFADGPPALAAMLEAIDRARHHIHLETFIFQPDQTGRRVLDALTAKARQGVQVRLLYDAMGTRRLSQGMLQALQAAGGQCCVFLPLNPFRRRLQVNMRNHRKILVVDGQVGFVGGQNIGDEYQGLVPRFGYWRDTHLRVEGPAVAGLQRVFAEDWDFALGENLNEPEYFPAPRTDGDIAVQVIESGPDREMKSIREIYFAAILRARHRVWIATPYFVPDPGLLDALSLAGYMGVDVRLLGLYHPDKWIPYFAGRYYWTEMMQAGVQVYQYARGMMHSKVVLVDGEWASVGTANMDYRSLYLNFEVNCLIYSPPAVARLEAAFRNDLAAAIRLDRQGFGRRPFSGRLLENASRLLSPVL